MPRRTGEPGERFRSGSFDHDGTPIGYDRREGVGPPLIFVPGWCCSRRDWHSVADALPGRATAAISPPGQGESPPSDKVRTVADLGAAVAATVVHLGWTEIVLVGHSMGGAVAVEAAKVLEHRASRVVCLDSLTYDSWYRRRDDAYVRRTLDAFGTDFEAGIRRLVGDLFVDRTRTALIEDITASMRSVPIPDALTALRALLEWDRDRALAESVVTVDVIAARAFLNTETARRLSARVRIRPVDFGGHFFFREDPMRTAGVIARLLAGDSR